MWEINWGLVLLILAVASVGFLMLTSVAGGEVDPWASRQLMRFGVGLVVMLAIAMVDIKFWLRWAYVIYGLSLLALIGVEVMGEIGMGARRWIALGPFQFQPSEVMKLALVLALARYFHGLSYEDIGRLRWLLVPLALVAMPVMLVLRQPDLGTALMILIAAGLLFFAAGVRLWKFALVIVVILSTMPVAWEMLHGYQKQRVMTFLNPETDPLGSGYHILQSKIALGSGGVFGKGYAQGTQSQLSFLPEKHTDFIFTTFAEEFGLAGAIGLLGLYGFVLAYGFAIGMRARNQFGRLIAFGVTCLLFIYVFINIAMVTGLVPVVGVPLPLVSYGGTSMMTLLAGFGLVLCVWVHRDAIVPRRPGRLVD
ncbi:rod shape-determining protein RodA [Marinibaculum pumilum]|uniref:Peptidoglycan glycosyltransferase MrdB n=1 Tax=Marinibaculum pumilum TaxID=1766165 RepID=A0ABV7LAZ5_9PROT